MKQEQTDYREEQGNLPYKTYDEILSEKNRQERFHHGMVIVSGIFLMLCAVIVGISMIWSNSSNPLELFRQNGDAGGLKLNFLGANADNPVLGNDGNAFLPPFAIDTSMFFTISTLALIGAALKLNSCSRELSVLSDFSSVCGSSCGTPLKSAQSFLVCFFCAFFLETFRHTTTITTMAAGMAR